MLAVRASVVVELIVAAMATVLLASSPAPPTRAFAMPTLPHVEIRPVPPVVAVDTCSTLPATVDREYRASHFRAAGRALPASCKDAIELLARLADEWAIGMNRAGSPDERFDALEQARRHDLALGGAHADAIDDATRAVVVRAAVAFTAEHYWCSVERAVATAHLLGVHDRRLFAVERRLANRCTQGPPEYCN
jgi:hypothetical protein